MKDADSSGQLAVLIDADNVPSRIISGLMTEVANYGTASVRRIYGDWTSPYMKSWRECLLEHSIVPIQQFAYTTGKNATDGSMIIDAMDLLYRSQHPRRRSHDSVFRTEMWRQCQTRHISSQLQPARERKSCA